MTVAAAVVAVGFGLLVGWGLGGRDYAPRPVLIALLAGLAVGAGILALSSGTDPSLAGWSLVLGCGGALAISGLRIRTRG